MKRSRMSKRSSRKNFSRNASRTHVKNLLNSGMTGFVRRGGYRI